MGWGRSSSAGRRTVAYRIPAPHATPLRESPAGGGGAAFAVVVPGDSEPLEVVERVRPAMPVPAEPCLPSRQRRALPVYDVATGQDLETPVNLDNTLLSNFQYGDVV